MFGVAGETHIHDSFKVIVFDKRKDIKPSSIDKSLCTCDVETLIICISNKLKYLKNKAKKQKSAKSENPLNGVVYRTRTPWDYS